MMTAWYDYSHPGNSKIHFTAVSNLLAPSSLKRKKGPGTTAPRPIGMLEPWDDEGYDAWKAGATEEPGCDLPRNWSRIEWILWIEDEMEHDQRWFK